VCSHIHIIEAQRVSVAAASTQSKSSLKSTLTKTITAASTIVDRLICIALLFIYCVRLCRFTVIRGVFDHCCVDYSFINISDFVGVIRLFILEKLTFEKLQKKE